MIITSRTRERGTTGITIGGEQLRKVESFKYLGSLIQENGRNYREIHERGRKAEAFRQCEKPDMEQGYTSKQQKGYIPDILCPNPDMSQKLGL